MSIESMIEATIGREGGYSDNPNDPGGATRWGITERIARKHGYTGSMRDLPREKAVAIYRTATKGLIDELRKELNRLKERCEEAEERMRECERRHAETEAELLGVKRLLQAQGDIRNRIQTGVAAERLLGKGGEG